MRDMWLWPCEERCTESELPLQGRLCRAASNINQSTHNACQWLAEYLKCAGAQHRCRPCKTGYYHVSEPGIAPSCCRNTYIMAAVHGGGYCSSAGLAVRTIMANALRVVAVDTVGDALVFLGKLSVMAGPGRPS